MSWRLQWNVNQHPVLWLTHSISIRCSPLSMCNKKNFSGKRRNLVRLFKESYSLIFVFFFHALSTDLRSWHFCQKGWFEGRIQDFKLGREGAHLKKLRRAEGGAKIVGVFRVKNHDFTPKNHIFTGSAPGFVNDIFRLLVVSYNGWSKILSDTALAFLIFWK